MLDQRKLLASDYDGTFHRHCENDLKTNLEAVENWTNDGNLFAFSTGRDVASMKYEQKVKNLKYDYIISLNGAFVVDSEDNIIFKKAIEKPLALEIYEMLKEKHGDELIISNGFDGYNRVHQKKRHTCEVAKESYERNAKIFSNDLDKVFENDIFLFGFVNETLEEAEQFKQEILNKFGNQVDVFINVRYINIVPKGISKASGLEFVAKHTKIDRDNISAIGDDLNDIPMLEKFNGYAVKNARSEAKDVANATFDSVAHLIEAKL